MIFRDDNKYPIEQWSNILKGEPVFILGNGPSLPENDLSLLNDFFTIGINRIYILMDPTILIWQDKGLYKDGVDKLEECASIKCCRTHVDRKGRWTNFKLESNPYKFHKNPHHLWGFGCTGALAIQLGVAMGAGAVVLLGIDCDYESPEKTDFYGKNEEHRPHTVRNFHKAMKWVKRDCPIPVHNCGRTKYWPRESLVDVIEQLSPTSRSRMQWLSSLRIESEALEE